MFTVTESHEDFEGHTYTSHQMDAAELVRWMTYIAEDGGTVARVNGTTGADQLATLDRTMHAAGLVRIVSAPIGAGYAVTYGPRVRVS